VIINDSHELNTLNACKAYMGDGCKAQRTKEAKMAFCVFGQPAVNIINIWIIFHRFFTKFLIIPST
jgi:hypothetical protein